LGGASAGDRRSKQEAAAGAGDVRHVARCGEPLIPGDQIFSDQNDNPKGVSLFIWCGSFGLLHLTIE
jgi:hypothetical protein